jgi:uncharacterized protein YaaR (DUF327 family)
MIIDMTVIQPGNHLDLKIDRWHTVSLEISLDDIRNESTAYQKFLDGIRKPQTLRKYKNAINQFLQILPPKIFDLSLSVMKT